MNYACSGHTGNMRRDDVIRQVSYSLEKRQKAQTIPTPSYFHFP